MRFLDLAAAALVGVISVSLVAFMDPLPFSAASQRCAEEAALRGLLLRIVYAEGLPWFRSATPRQICYAVEAYTNSSVTVSAVVNGTSCRGPPPEGVASATLTLPFVPARVTIQAWASAGQ